MSNAEPSLPTNQAENTTWSGRDVLLISIGVVLVLIVTMILLFGITTLAINDPTKNPIQQNTLLLSIGSAVVKSLALVGSVYLFGIRRRNFPWSATGLRATSQKWIAIAVGLGLIAIPLSTAVALSVQYLLDLPADNPQLPFLSPADLSPFGMLIMVLLVGLIVPFAEELYFRGILFEWLNSRFGVWVGILVSSLIFGIVHFEISISSAAFILGLLMAWVYYKSRSIWPGFIIHAINNGVKIIFLYLALSMDIPLL